MTPELMVFKDADALDRWRICDLDPAYLRTRAARQLLDAGRGFWEATRDFMHTTDAFDTIVVIAREHGLVAEA